MNADSPIACVPVLWAKNYEFRGGGGPIRLGQQLAYDSYLNNLIFSMILPAYRQHRAVPNMKYIHRLIADDKENPVSPAIAGTEEQLADRLLQERALWSHRAALGKTGESLDARTNFAQPLLRRLRRAVSNVVVIRLQVRLGVGCRHHAIAQRCAQPPRSSSSKNSSAGRPSPLSIWPRACRILATESNWSATA